MKSINKSFKIALSGIISAISILFMIATGLFPFSTYFLPAISGALISIIMIEFSFKQSFLVYLSISLLSIFIVPDREATIMYIGFFGYYSIIKSIAENSKNRITEYFLKFLTFNLSTIISYICIIYILGINNIIFNNQIKLLSILFMIIIGNITFFIYDRTLTTFVTLYTFWFKPKYFKHIK